MRTRVIAKRAGWGAVARLSVPVCLSMLMMACAGTGTPPAESAALAEQAQPNLAPAAQGSAGPLSHDRGLPLDGGQALVRPDAPQSQTDFQSTGAGHRPDQQAAPHGLAATDQRSAFVMAPGPAGPKRETVSKALPPAHPQTAQWNLPAVSPSDRIVRHAKAFNAPVLDVYAEPHGRPIHTIAETALPRVVIGPNGERGVPVYAEKGAFVRIAMPQGHLGWVTVDVVRLTARDCQLPEISTRSGRGPIGAGATDVACVN